ncbi:type VI secretion system accessory protein TagJ [Gemmata sp. JC717]|uniref:type VI secretion system accessory protein TagJ n=1 Tax=Gemmata algarum TaxID=2975278 RepID=UPI0021BA8B97|nr:type VI secretion system accessory protein TagJ [Gemmata algarum]MDY3557278.1 type VI secretion system accessory protein TagJ [Gemmata algarum]
MEPTAHDMLADGRLADAVALQEAAVARRPDDPAALRLFADLLAFAGRLDEATEHIARVHTDAPEWPETERGLHRLFRSERLRTLGGREPTIVPEPPPDHAARRWKAVKRLRRAEPERAVRAVDAADRVSPVVRGFIDGREFDGLRDADDRFASVLEAFRGGEYLWVAWEALRKVRLAPAEALLDQLYRPAALTLRDGSTFDVHLPLVYPASYRADGAFALGLETDHVCPDNGPTRCVGAKLLLVGDEDEIPLSECRLIEVK